MTRRTQTAMQLSRITDSKKNIFVPIISLSDLKVGQWVRVTAKPVEDGTFEALKIIVRMGSKALANKVDIESLIRSIDEGGKTLCLLDREFVLPEGIKIRGLQGKFIALQDLKVGDRLKLKGRYLELQGFVPEKIKMKKATGFDTVVLKGAINKIDRKKKTLNVLGFGTAIGFRTPIGELLNAEQFSKRFLKHARPVFLAAAAALNNAGVPFFLDGGTLLGCVREGGFLPHDSDIDLGIFFKDRNKQLHKEMLRRGFKRNSYTEVNGGGQGFTETYLHIRRRIKVDFCYFYEDGNKMYSYGFENQPDKTGNEHLIVLEYVWEKQELEVVDFMNAKVRIPKNAEYYLEEHYGKDWRKPNSNWDFQYDPKNMVKYTKKVGVRHWRHW
jgi:hypothetical protein